MKCRQPNTDRDFEAFIFANGNKCAEYAVPSQESSDSNVVECFVPIEEGDKISVRGTFNGTVLNAVFDVVADGAYLRDTRNDGKGDEAKFLKKRKIDFATFYDLPDDGSTSIMGYQQVKEGHLYAKSLGSTGLLGPTGCHRSVLSIIASLSMQIATSYEHGYNTLTLGEWDEVMETAVPPTLELEVKALDSELSKVKQNKHRRHFAQTRPGSKPWAILNFYYRTKDALDAAGCIPRLPEAQALEPSPVSISAPPLTLKPKTQAESTKEQTAVKREFAEDQVSITSEERTDREASFAGSEALFISGTSSPELTKRLLPSNSSSAPEDENNRRFQTPPAPTTSNTSATISEPTVLPQKSLHRKGKVLPSKLSRKTEEAENQTSRQPSTGPAAAVAQMVARETMTASAASLAEVKTKEIAQSTTTERASKTANIGETQNDQMSEATVDRASVNRPLNSPHTSLRSSTAPRMLETPVSLKRTASVDSLSSSKRARFDDLANRKAELRKVLQDKKRRNEAAEADLKLKQVQREEEEQRRVDAEMAQIADLERMIAEEDEEFNEFEAATKIEEAEIEEAIRGREAAEMALRESEASDT